MASQGYASIMATTLLTLAISTAAPAQNIVTPNHSTKHHHYVVVDKGSLGGPDSVIYEIGVRYLNNQGTLTGCADTPTLDSNSPQNPYFLYPDLVLDPFIQHSFEWELGEKIEDLGTLPGGSSSCTQWISDHGWIVGGSTNGRLDPLAGYPEVNATLWRHGRIQNLGTFGGYESLAWSVNDRGQVVGFAANTTPDQFAGSLYASSATQVQAFLWQGGQMRDLGTLGGPDSDALLINERGQIAGFSQINSTIVPTLLPPQPAIHPFLSEHGKMTDLGTLGGAFGVPTAMNDRGQVVGDSNLAGDQAFHPFLWDHGTLKDLGTLGGSLGEPRSINESGEAAGWALLPGDQVVHATLWKDGETIDLGATADFPCSYANGINARGQVLGALQHCPNNAPREAFLWENGDLVNLNTLIPSGLGVILGGAINANGRGEIAAVGTLSNGDFRALVLIPCDEEHPDLPDCQYDLVETEIAAQLRPAQIAGPSAAANVGQFGPGYRTPRYRSALSRHNQRFDGLQQK
jgi:probable HAF family extracellular repeat protein